jgi:carboxymethylenebutenolidase
MLVEIGGSSCYVAQPPAPPKAGLLLLPTYAGTDHFACDYAERFAEHDFVTVVWNPYVGTNGPLSSDVARERIEKLKDAACIEHLAACHDYLQHEFGVSEIGTIGFCLGGRFALLLASRDPRIAACVAVYPSLFTPKPEFNDEDALELASGIDVPVQLIVPGQDKVTAPEVYRALSTSLNARRATTTIVTYPEAGHGFMHHPGPANEAATDSARPQIDAFLNAHLGAPG